jgi:mannose-6-phosphate isomerase-like protein (cupin superfamily)
MKYLRIYADPAGESHTEDVEVELAQIDFAPPAPPVNLSSFSPALQYAFCSFPASWQGNQHPTPHRQFFFILSGEGTLQVSDGEVRHFGAGSVLLAEDTTGKGHISWVVSKTDLLAVVVQLPD